MAKQNSSRKLRVETFPYPITKITVSGYKSISHEQSIEIRPLTILAGANSSGKSSMMQPLLLLKQTLEESYDPGPLLLNGPNVKLTTIDQALSQDIAGKHKNDFYIGITTLGVTVTTYFEKQAKKLGIQQTVLEMLENQKAS